MKTVAKKILCNILEKKPEPNSERLIRALSRSGTPDRVPFMELFADGEVMAGILEKPLNYFSKKIKSQKEWEERMYSLIEFHELLGYDYVRAETRGFKSIRKTQKQSTNSLDNWLRTKDVATELNRGERVWVNEGTGVIGNWKDFQSYNWEDPEDIAEEGNDGLEWICDHAPPGMGIVTGGGTILEPVMILMGTKNFYVSLYKQPDLIDAMFKKIGELSIVRFKLAAKTSRKIVAFWGSDDWGYRDGPMISPSMMRRWVFPIHKKMAEIAHAKGSLYILHSCGNLEILMDDIIEDIKVDAKHSFEDTCFSVRKAKMMYGNRIALIGGVDMDVLTRGSVPKVRNYVRNILKTCKPGGGYCLGSGNSVANYTPLENYLAMLNIGLEEGWYN